MPSGTFLPPGITTSNVKISTGGSDNQVLTAVDGETAQGEANLTFDGSTLTVTGDAVVANGNGAVIGHTAQVTTNVVPEFQILGAGQEDSYMLIGRWQNNAYGPAIQIVKSRDPAIADGSFAIVQDDDQIGDIQFRVDDGTDYQNISAQWYAEVDDGSPAANDVGAAFVWKQQPGGGGSLQETMRIAANGMMTYGGGVSRDTGIVFDNGGTDYHVGIDQTADDLVIGTGTTLGSNIGLSVDSALNIGIGTTPLPANSQVYMNMPATSRSATTAFYRLFIDNGTAITQTTNAASHIGTVSIDEPNITLASSGTVTNAFTLRVTGAPTEGTNNYALWVDDGATRLEGPVTISTAGHPLIAQTSTRWGGVYLEDTSGNNMFSVYPDDADLGGTIMTLYDADTAKIVFDTHPVTLQVGHADAEDVRILFDGAEQDYYMGIDDGDNFFKIGAGSTVGTTPFLRIGASGTYAYGMVIGGTNVSSGVSDTATGVAFMPHITSHSGDDKSISLVRIGGELAGQSMTTGGNTDIATSLHLSEPNISTSHTIDASATLYIKDAASEATTDYALWVDDGTTRLDGTLTMNEQNITHVGNIYADNYAGDVDSDTYMNMAGSNVINFYTGGGKSLTIEGSTTSAITVGSAAAADTRVIFDGAAQDGCIGMDDSTDSLTIQLGSTLGHSTNPHIALRPADGGTSTQGHYIAEAHAGTFTSDGSSTVVIGASFGHDLVAANGDTSYHTIVGMGGWVGGSVTTQGNSETIPVISTLHLSDPTITVGSGDTVTASAALWISNIATEATNDYAIFVDDGPSRFDGTITCTSLTETSDITAKENIVTIDTAIDTVKKLRPVTFDWKEDKKESAGFIAQEVEEVIPYVVEGTGNEYKSIKSFGILAQVTKALQESIDKIETLEKKVEELQGA